MRLVNTACVLVLCVLVLGGCVNRSISNPGLRGSNHLYRGELDSLELLGIDPDAKVDAASLRATLQHYAAPTLQPEDSVLLIQSGAATPDEELLASFSGQRRIVPFSGIPPHVVGPDAQIKPSRGLKSSFRQAAAGAGCTKILVVSGELSTELNGLGTRAVSWVPVVGWMIPDEEHVTSIVLDATLVDTVSGHWVRFHTEPISDAKTKSPMFGDHSGMDQVHILKAAAYPMLAEAVRSGQVAPARAEKAAEVPQR